MTDLPPDSLAARFARRVAERDNPPPVVLSHEPAAVEARLQAWLLGTHQLRDPRARLCLGKMLLALMEARECSSAQLGAAAGQQRAAAPHLAQLGLTDWEDRGLVRHHRLLPATEDALLRVVAGEAGVRGYGKAVCPCERSNHITTSHSGVTASLHAQGQTASP